MNPSYLETLDGRRIAYHHSEGALPGIVFLGGFRSDMTGTKATFVEAWARGSAHAFLRFDYSGHGASSGDFLDGSISAWSGDAEHVVSALTHGPQILVGSSMGSWIALLLARRIPERIAGFVGIAAAPDFTEDSMYAELSPAQRAALEATGHVDTPSDYSDEPYRITRHLIDDGRKNLVLRAPLRLPFPVRLLHGTADTDAPASVALRLVEHAQASDCRLTLVKDADHRFSSPENLALIGSTLEELVTSLTPA
jgi:pimeloyl-ACP methyl ester carboxylesterase